MKIKKYIIVMIVMLTSFSIYSNVDANDDSTSCSGSQGYINGSACSSSQWQNCAAERCDGRNDGCVIANGGCGHWVSCPSCPPPPPPHQCIGTRPVGSTACPHTKTGLTVDTDWHKVSDCDGATKCAYTKKADCGEADNNEYISTSDVESAGTCSDEAIETDFFDYSGLAIGAGWSWKCTRTGYDTANCSATKTGVCISGSIPSEGFTNLDDACEYGAFHSVHLDNNNILHWTCGADDSSRSIEYHIGSFTDGHVENGIVVPPDGIPPSSTGGCQCTPVYEYTCINSSVGSCTGRCGQTVAQIVLLHKKDTSCFPGEPLTPTNEEKEANPCLDKQAQCPPCGINDGESGIVNEMN